MEVTFEQGDDGNYTTEKCFNTACIKNADTSRHPCDNGCSYTANTGQCRNFKGGKAKGYEVAKPFSIIDIYEKSPCSCEYAALLKENGSRDIDAEWRKFGSVKKSKVRVRYRKKQKVRRCKMLEMRQQNTKRF